MGGRPLESTLLVEDSEEAAVRNRENTVIITPFFGIDKNPKDMELSVLGDLILQLNQSELSVPEFLAQSPLVDVRDGPHGPFYHLVVPEPKRRWWPSWWSSQHPEAAHPATPQLAA
eukprot:NODE_3052_length_499_cov_99.871111_g2643_i0.p1 GENE.NODE_3052_length_499_cov_99.871111_g2643_i0~~NODE_3052_length_499_cov_99.871111_g2643_i0.p1  ORF type:complete len:116 (-),score=35.04 NODE_3052_length_499_cov_99.871111_g2643_i0:125-472(-)